MLAERRARALRGLNASLGEVRATRQVFHNAMSVLEAHAFDLPFTLLYELAAQEGWYRLAGSVGVALDDPIVPAILFEDSATPWPADLSSARAPITVALPRDGAARGPYEEPAHTALVFAITAPDTPRAPALMMVGTSSPAAGRGLSRPRWICSSRQKGCAASSACRCRPRWAWSTPPSAKPPTPAPGSA